MKKQEVLFVREGSTVVAYIPIRDEGVSISHKEGQATKAIKDYCAKLYQLGEKITRIDRKGYAGYSQNESGNKFYCFTFILSR